MGMIVFAMKVAIVYISAYQSYLYSMDTCIAMVNGALGSDDTCLVP